ncbi:hypothetical protein AMK59_4585 [Oryctes borbonicus]|uniref:Uncharacterized protein n=1 Tax=Oryctes borbonicus TaxID=1629725 RepID=A0A0T6B5E8_9SCAR|nr:hypothetical protein AMK59_4585 [Oryctes borbonicus]
MTEVEIHQTTTPTDRQKNFQTVGNEPKFPITNGSLYTSVDGRVPIIHNYRRHKDRTVRPVENNLINLGVHATYLKQHQDLLESSPGVMTEKPQEYSCATACNNNDQIERKKRIVYAPRKRVSLSQNGINRVGHDTEIAFHKRQANPLRLSKSEDSLCDIEKYANLLRCDKHQVSDSEDDYFSDVNVDVARVSDDESSKSSYSITTEANCDFDFYQTKTDPSYETFQYLQLNVSRLEQPKQEPPPTLQTFKPPQLLPRISPNKNENITDNSDKQPKIVKVDVNRNFRITRSNSKRSLENFKAYIDDDRHFDNSDKVIRKNHQSYKSQRSYSYIDLDDTIRRNNNNNNVDENKFELAWTGLDLSFTKESLGGKKQMNPSGSVPDLKKIFISDYL